MYTMQCGRWAAASVLRRNDRSCIVLSLYTGFVTVGARYGYLCDIIAYIYTTLYIQNFKTYIFMYNIYDNSCVLLLFDTQLAFV